MQWPLLGAIVAALSVTALAGANHGPADAVTAIHMGVSQTGGATDVRCNVDTHCLDALQDFATATGAGLRGGHVATTGTGPGLRGFTNSTSGSAYAIHGQVNPASPGGYSTAVRGENNGTGGFGIGVWGSQNGSGWGGYFTAAGSGIGVLATSGAGGYGVYGSSPDAAGTGVYGSGATGVYGSGATYGVDAVTNSTAPNAAGVRGSINSSAAGAAGVWGRNSAAACCGFGVYGEHTGQGIGVYGESSNGFAVSGYSPNNWSGYFQGNMRVVGNLQKSSGSFTIDHPLDPANKYLSHSFVESPDMMNVYNGNVTTNVKGFATVTLPDYFQALNRSFRYQLTIVGTRGWRARVVKEIAKNRFTIQTDEPGVKVSWQVTGVRQDRWANENRIKVIESKNAADRGQYLNPELFNKPRSASVVDLKTYGRPEARRDTQQQAMKSPTQSTDGAR